MNGPGGVDLVAALFLHPDAIILRDKDRKIVFLNQRAEELFRLKGSTVIGKASNELHASDAGRLRAALTLDLASGQDASRFSLPDGTRTRAFHVADVMLEGGVSMRVLRETTREEEISRLKTQFMSVAAHQLRTPVATLQWVAHMFLTGEVGPVTDAQRELLERSIQTIDRMNRLITDLLDVTRIEEGRLGYQFKSEPAFAVLVERIAEGLRGRAETKGLFLTIEKPETPLPPLLIDENRFSLALENVIANAITYTFHGGVTVRVERRKDMIAVIVADTGIGVPEHDRDKLFGKFFRAQNVIQMGIEGTGLGLFIVRSILRRHGGDISIASTEEKGTTVTLTLPLDPKKVPDGNIPLEEVTV